MPQLPNSKEHPSAASYPILTWNKSDLQHESAVSILPRKRDWSKLDLSLGKIVSN